MIDLDPKKFREDLVLEIMGILRESYFPQQANDVTKIGKKW